MPPTEGLDGLGPNPCEATARRRASGSESLIDVDSVIIIIVKTLPAVILGVLSDAIVIPLRDVVTNHIGSLVDSFTRPVVIGASPNFDDQ